MAQVIITLSDTPRAAYRCTQTSSPPWERHAARRKARRWALWLSTSASGALLRQVAPPFKRTQRGASVVHTSRGSHE